MRLGLPEWVDPWVGGYLKGDRRPSPVGMPVAEPRPEGGLFALVLHRHGSRTIAVSPPDWSLAGVPATPTLSFRRFRGILGVWLCWGFGGMAAPWSSGFVELRLPLNTEISPIAFEVGDDRDSPSNLVVSATFSNPRLLPPETIHISGSGASRFLELQPQPNLASYALIDVTVRNSFGESDTTSFWLSMLALTQTAQEFPSYIPHWFEPADFNSDGRSDLYFAGSLYERFIGDQPVQQLFTSRLGELVPGDVVGVGPTAAAFGDYDNDGDVDRAQQQIILRNAPGSWEVVATPPGDMFGVFAWADFDQDGLLDVIAANTSFLPSLMLRNEGAQFVEVPVPFIGGIDPRIAWGDADNDGDPDFAITAKEFDWGLVPSTVRIYRNDAGTFSLAAELPGAHGGTLQWADANGDGRSDLLVSGHNVSGDRERLLVNLGQFQFAALDLNNGRQPTAGAGLVDLDSDGTPDLVEFGEFGFTVRRNDGGSRFPDSNAIPFEFPATQLRWADFDGDGAFDLVAGGRMRFGQPNLGRTAVFKNHWRASGRATEQPEAAVDGNRVRLQWPGMAGPGTGPCTFNVRVGTTPGGSDVVSPLADVVTGRRWVASAGNAGYAQTMRLNLLPPGRYYWSVQAVDSTWRGSAWGPESTFSVTTVLPNPRIGRLERLALNRVILEVVAAPGSLLMVEASYGLTEWSETYRGFVGEVGRIGVELAWDFLSRQFFRVRSVP